MLLMICSLLSCHLRLCLMLRPLALGFLHATAHTMGAANALLHAVPTIPDDAHAVLLLIISNTCSL